MSLNHDSQDVRIDRDDGGGIVLNCDSNDFCDYCDFYILDIRRANDN
jgi:hypothetical protein